MELYQAIKSYWNFINSTKEFTKFEYRRVSKKHTEQITTALMENGTLLSLTLICIGTTLAFLLQVTFSIVSDYKELRDFFNLLTQSQLRYNLVFIGVVIFLFIIAKSIYKIRANAFWERNSLNSTENNEKSKSLRIIKTIPYLISYSICLFFTLKSFYELITNNDLNFIPSVALTLFILFMSLAFYFSGLKATGLIFNKEVRNPPVAILTMKRQEPGLFVLLLTLVISIIGVAVFASGRAQSFFNMELELRILLTTSWQLLAIFYINWFLILLFYQFDDPRGIDTNACNNESSSEKKQQKPRKKRPRSFIYSDILLIGLLILLFFVALNCILFTVTHDEQIKYLIIEFVQNRTFDPNSSN